MKEHIMLAYDGSPCSRRDLEKALEMQQDLAATLDVVTVVPSLGTQFIQDSYPLDVPAMSRDQKAAVVEKLKQLKDECAVSGHDVSIYILEGDVVSRLLEHAGDHKTDLILVGTRGRGGFEGLLLGSVALKLVTHAKIPVVVIK